jgi:hypothetical protein
VTVLINESYSGDQIKKEMGGHVAYGSGRERRSTYKVLVGKPEGKTPVAYPYNWRNINTIYIRI